MKNNYQTPSIELLNVEYIKGFCQSTSLPGLKDGGELPWED